MQILGISCFYHDSASALIRDGMLVAAAEEERFSRIKHDRRFPERAIDFCLRRGAIGGSELDYVVFYEKPLVKFERVLMTTLGAYPGTWRVFPETMASWFNEKLWVKGHILRKLGVPADRILFVEHHLSHAASALFCSPFEESSILTVDGVGEWTTTTLGRGRADWRNGGENHIDLFEEIHFPHSLGLLYSAFTAFLGFEVNEGEHKVMGMAPYGEPRYLDKIYKLIEVNGDGSFRLNMEYFSFHRSLEHTYNARFVDLFGKPRERGSEFYFSEHAGSGRQSCNQSVSEQNQKYADIAASVQRVTEEVLLKMANHLHRQTGLRKLCIAGGVALNSLANYRLLTETPFEEIFIQPAAGDSGGALGAALYAYHVLLKQPRRFVLEHCYWGEEFTAACISDFLQKNHIPHQRIEEDHKLIDVVADELARGRVVAWFQGRFEWGPRALGSRSILADPRRADMKSIVNKRIKYRELFRPFAPAVLEERAPEYFVLPQAEKLHPARFMLLVVPIREEKQPVIPAVNHFGTARLQMIQRRINPLYYGLVERFGEATGVPVLLNTSYNLKGEPIVANPADALWTFNNSGLDLLVMDHFLIRKERSEAGESVAA